MTKIFFDDLSESRWSLTLDFFSDRYAVRFVPRENGVHFIHVRLNGNHIPGSPFRLFVGKQDADASLVRAYGDGLSHGQTGKDHPNIVFDSSHAVSTHGCDFIWNDRE